MPPVTLALHAMATRFELVLPGDDPVRLRAAGEEAFEEIERLEAQLSLYRPTSEIAYLNARAAQGPVRVTPSLFALLERARLLHEASAGAFDITIAPLVRCWGFMGGRGHLPDPATLDRARSQIGMSLVELDPERLTVRFARPGVMLDLGAIGKGYAVERAADLLRDAGVTSALLHGGTSTIQAIGCPPEADCWKVGIEIPINQEGAGSPLGAELVGGPQSNPRPQPVRTVLLSAEDAADRSPGQRLVPVALRDESLSVSAVWGRCFEAEGKTFGHVLDPRTGNPVVGPVLAAVVLASATETDALSTALLVLGRQGHDLVSQSRARIRTLLVWDSEGRRQAEAHNMVLD